MLKMYSTPTLPEFMTFPPGWEESCDRLYGLKGEEVWWKPTAAGLKDLGFPYGSGKRDRVPYYCKGKDMC